MAQSKPTTRNRRKLALVWGGATVSALALTSGAVAFAVDNDSTSNKDERCAAILEGAEADSVSSVAVSPSGEYFAGGGRENAFVWNGGKATTIDLVNANVAAVNSDGMFVGTDSEGKPFVHNGKEQTELTPPEDMDAESLTVTDIGDNGTIVGSVSTMDHDIPVKWDDASKPATELPIPEESSGEAQAITSDNVIVGDIYKQDAEEYAGQYWTEDGSEGEFESFPDQDLYPEIVAAEGDWAVTASNIDDEGEQYYHLVPITGSDDPVEVPLNDDAENTGPVNVDQDGNVYGNNEKGKAVMVADGDVTKLPKLKDTSRASVTGVSTDGGVIAGSSDKTEEDQLPTTWGSDCSET